MSFIEGVVVGIGLVTLTFLAGVVIVGALDFIVPKVKYWTTLWTTPRRKYGILRTARYRLGLFLLRPVMDRHYRWNSQVIRSVYDEFGEFESIDASWEEKSARRRVEMMSWFNITLANLWKLNVHTVDDEERP